MLDLRTLPLNALRAFVSTARHLNMGRAGDELGVTHGAISHQIKILETALGVRLFTRAKNGLALTAAGSMLYDSTVSGFGEIIKGAHKLVSDSLAGQLVIGCTQTIGASWAIRHIGAFQQRYPEIDVAVEVLSPGQMNIPERINLAICYGRPEPGNRSVRLLASPPLFPVCSPKLIHGSQLISRGEHIANLPLIHDKINNWKIWFEAQGIAYPASTPSMYFDNSYLSLLAALHGYGVALCNSFEIMEHMKEGRLIKLSDKTIPEAQAYYLLTDAPTQQSQRTKLFEGWILQAIEAAA